MTVRIIEEKPDPSVVKTIVCRNCGAKLEYTPNDVKIYHGHDYSGGSSGSEWLDCPNCLKPFMTRSW